MAIITYDNFQLVKNGKIERNYAGMLESTAPTFDDSTAYTAGQYVVHNNEIRKFTEAHAAGAWKDSDNEAASLEDVLTDINTAITDKGVTVPSGNKLVDCPQLITDIPTGDDSVKFLTLGNQEQDNKDNPMIGGLSNKTFGANFYKTTEDGVNFFNTAGETTALYWVNGIGDERPQTGDKYFISLLYKDVLDNSNYRTMILVFFNYCLRVGTDNGQTHLCVGITGANSSVIAKHNSWTVVSGLGSTDYMLTNSSLIRDRIYSVEALVEFLETRCVTTIFVDGDFVLSIKFDRPTMAYKNNDICTGGNNRRIAFANIKVQKL